MRCVYKTALASLAQQINLVEGAVVGQSKGAIDCGESLPVWVSSENRCRTPQTEDREL